MKEGTHHGVKLKNYCTGNAFCDRLHQNEPLVQNTCSDKRCLGSTMLMPGYATKTRSKEEVISMAKDFFNAFYSASSLLNHTERWTQVLEDITATGTYELTEDELLFGAKLAWRNASRCIGRIQWNKLKMFDARKVKTAKEMFDAICTHVEYGTNGGNIRSTITVFPQRRDGRPDFRVWNSQLVGYAGYITEDGHVVGDPLNVEFTKVCQRLGWKSEGTQWDVLPIIVSAEGKPELFELPANIILQVPLSHPTFDWFAALGLRWYALPAVANMLFDVGGIQFTAAPFNGWYMVTEVACRDLCDQQRYNILEVVAAEMGEDTSSSATLWKDRALVEVNLAVLYSYQQKAVTMVDHHTASDNFIKHIDNEQKARNGCPADWVWIVPPMSGSVTSVFHQEMALYSLKPSYEYQEPAWRTYDWGDDNTQGPRFTLRQIAIVVQASVRLFTSALKRRTLVTILYATETGKSEGFAKQLAEVFSHGLNPKVVCMSDYDMSCIEDESLLLVVTSTYGNGDAPVNGEGFSRKLSYLRNKEGITTSEPLRSSDLNGNSIQMGTLSRRPGLLSKVRFSVFALGSSTYPHFCAFGHHIDALLSQLGGRRLLLVKDADEIGGQDEVFRKWVSALFPEVCSSFNLMVDKSGLEKVFTSTEVKVTPDSVRFVMTRGELLDAALTKTLKKHVTPCKLVRKTFLHQNEKSGSTVLLEISSDEVYEPGDHVGVCPENSHELVDGVLARIDLNVNANQPVKLQIHKNTTVKSWVGYPNMPTCSLRTLLSRFLDITTPLKPKQLEHLLPYVTDQKQREVMKQLVMNSVKYEEWRSWCWPHLLEVMQQFPSLKVTASVLVTILAPLRPRFYSISSSPEAHPGQIHLTVAVVSFRTQNGRGPPHYGVCSNYLSNASPGDSIYLYVRKSHNFSLPSDKSKPIIMVGPGAGIAPFRGFWQHRMMKTKASPGSEVDLKGMWLFFGCRTRDMELFKEEKAEAVKQGALEKKFLALSRDPRTPKTYVQDLMQKEGEAIYHKLKVEGGHLYVCGDVSMADGVSLAIVSIAQTHGHLDEESAQGFLKLLKEEKRYHEDIFGVTVHTNTAKNTKSKTASASKSWSSWLRNIFC